MLSEPGMAEFAAEDRERICTRIHSGDTLMGDSVRRVRFEASAGIGARFRPQKLMQTVSGQAWLATETVSAESLGYPRGVNRLLDLGWSWKVLSSFGFSARSRSSTGASSGQKARSLPRLTRPSAAETGGDWCAIDRRSQGVLASGEG